MAQICCSAVIRGEVDYIVNLDEWQEVAGDGGFGTVYKNPRDPTHVLKRLHDEVDFSNSLRMKVEWATHAKVIRARLSQIIDDPDPKNSEYVRRMCSTLRDSVTKGVGYDRVSKRIFLYQQLAPGASLESCFNRAAPNWHGRKQIAKNFAAAMVALSRCGVVHLDCRPVNVFVDLFDPHLKVTLIDLDGCGVLAGGQGRDSDWQTRPATMGKLDDACLPLWFPFDPTWQAPRVGNFRFAERWCVIVETWKILSWSNLDPLGWLELEYADELCSGFGKVRQLFSSLPTTLSPQEKSLKLKEIHRKVENDLRSVVQTAVTQTEEINWSEWGLGTNVEADNRFLREFALATIISILNPRDDRLPRREGSNHGEIPGAHWIQDNLIRIQRRYT